jgi:hypothetical protein
VALSDEPGTTDPANEAPSVAIEFADTVKAQITQALLSTLLERGGYRVTRLGIEELFGEIKFKQLEEYQALKLPMQLRYLPDLLVASHELTEAFLVEVKFRRRFDERTAQAVFKKLERQRHFWPESYAVIMISEPSDKPARFHQDYIRVLPPGQTAMLVDQSCDPCRRWWRLPPLHRVFRKLGASQPRRSEADFVIPALKSLARL